MVKHIYILLLAAGAITARAQNDNQFSNAGLNNIGFNNAPAIQAQSNPTGNQSFLQGSFQQTSLNNKDVPQQLDNNVGVPPQQAFNDNDNNVDVPVQQQSANQSKSSGSDGISFSLPKPSVSFGSGGSSRSSGKSHSQNFSKKMKKLNRRLTYAFAKKHKKSYTVDFCFAWAK
jgi:hypothetical protein